MWKPGEDLTAGMVGDKEYIQNFGGEPRDSGLLEDREALVLKLLILQL
jgi:hypothetical protein